MQYFKMLNLHENILNRVNFSSLKMFYEKNKALSFGKLDDIFWLFFY